MSDTQVSEPAAPPIVLPCPLPAPFDGEPEDLRQYRQSPGNERSFLQLRRDLRQWEEWRALATLMVLHAATLDSEAKAAELCLRAYELWLERVKDKAEAAHALARAVMLQPDNERAFERLHKLYESLGWKRELVQLLQWRLHRAERAEPRERAAMHIELAETLEKQFLDIANAVQHYEAAIAIDPGQRAAADHLLRLYIEAGAWRHAADLLQSELGRIDAAVDPGRVADLHLRLSRIESTHLENVAAGARHLQTSLKVQPNHIDALCEFGLLYLGSGKATHEGLAKAADIFFKAAELARGQRDHRLALRLLRRVLALRPDHQEASAVLEQTLIDTEDWLGLDDLYREWIGYFSGADAVPLLLRRARLLETKLERREEARQLYEEASRYQAPDSEAWNRLQDIYAASKDFQALAALLETFADRMPEQVPTEVLLRTAQLQRDELGSDERAAVFYYKVLEREPFNPVAFEGYKEHWRRKQNWIHLRDLILYQIEQASGIQGANTPLRDPAFAEEFVELAEICEKRLGDVDGALGAWHRMAAVYPADRRPREQIARIEKRARMWDNMVRVQEAELQRTTDPARRLDVLKRLTQVYRDRQLNPDRAIELYHEVLEIAPNDLQATRALASLYERTGDYARVTDLLLEQYERSRSNTERIALLRRMAELWHHELSNPERAVWACEQILSHAPADREALHRLQHIYDEQAHYEHLFEALERELKVVTAPDDKIKLLRRLAKVAEWDLRDNDRAAYIWEQLLSLQPHNFDIIDKVMEVYEQGGRIQDLANLLTKMASWAKTPTIRQLDYLLRLGGIAEASLHDSDAARAAFERALRLRPDHRGALEALVRLYRQAEAWEPLTGVLDTLRQLAETPDEEFRIAWECAEIFADRLERPEDAAKVLAALPDEIATKHPELARTFLDLHQRSGKPGSIVRQAELMLLAVDAPQDRRHLYDLISDTWLRQFDDRSAALATYERFTREFPDDLDGLWTMANLHEQAGNYEEALKTLERRLELSADSDLQATTLEHMARLSEVNLKEPTRALQLLSRALQLNPHNEALKGRLEAVTEQYDLWKQLLDVYEQHQAQLGEMGDYVEQVDVCLEASRIAENQLADTGRAFDWARRGYFVALDTNLDTAEVTGRLQQLAEDHSLWEESLSVVEQEIAMYEAREDDAEEVIQKLQQAAEIAEHQLDSPQRAVEYLQRAQRKRPDDEELAKQLEATAELHELWLPMVELNQARLERAETDLGRLDACTTIARLYEEKLQQHENAFHWLRRSWEELEDRDPGLAQEAWDAMVALAERRELWAPLADHHLKRGISLLEKGDLTAGFAALSHAARVYADELDDQFSGIRVLVQGLEYDTDGSALLPEIRTLSEDLDRRRLGQVPLGALALLNVIQRIIPRVDSETMQSLVKERAALREERLNDPAGALCEWLRLLRIDPDSEDVHAELRRITEAHGLWNIYLIVPAWRIDKSTHPAEQAACFVEIADVYENSLGRSEYALRARIEAWRRQPTLPARSGELDPQHAQLWRLAGMTGSYHTPPVPKDPLLAPQADAPELADEARWEEAGFSPSILDEAPVAGASEDDSDEVTGQIRTSDEETQLHESQTPLPVAVKESNTQVIGLDDMEEVDNTVEVAVDEIEEIQEVEEVVELDPEDEGEDIELQSDRIALDEPAKPPPPPPAPADVGLPPLVGLFGPVLPPRARVATAWDELALAYADFATASKQEKADVSLVLVRLWEEGAGQIERAFQQYEQALLVVPEHAEALAGLIDLSQRHDAQDRLLQAYQRLLAEATLPDHMVTQNLRLARLHEERGEIEAAEQSYRGALSVRPHHEECLEALTRLYEDQERWSDYADVYEEMLTVRESRLDEDERLEGHRKLALVLEHRLGRTEDAIEVLEALVREFRHRRMPYDELVTIVTAHGSWQKAVDTLRTAAENVQDEDFRLGALRQLGHIYRQHLQIPDRAIAAWNQILDAAPDDDEALAQLQELYAATGRHDLLLQMIDRRLNQSGDRDARVALLVAKAKALQDGSSDESAAITTLEQLLSEAPDNDDVVLGLSGLYRKAGRADDGIKLLRYRLQGVTDPERKVTLAAALSRTIWEEKQDTDKALEVVQQALAISPRSEALLRFRVTLARARHDLSLLVDSLAALGAPDALLEAANIARKQLKDEAKAVRFYSRVLAESKEDSDDPDNPKRLAAAIEGLVQLRIEQGDISGAVEFMDRQLAETEGPELRARLLTELGRITYRATGDLEAAQRRFDAALAEDPEYAPAKLSLGELLTEAGRLKEAERLLESAVDGVSLEGNRDHLVEGLVLLARVLEQTERSGEAYRRLTTALRHDPDDLGIRAAIVHNRHGAQRWRDVITSVDQLEKKLEAGVPITDKQRHRVSVMFVLAGESEMQLKQPDRAAARYRRALAIEPHNRRALEAIIPLVQEHGSLTEAAHHTEALARITEDVGVRAHRFLEAATLYNDAASAMADTGERSADGTTEDDLRRSLSECAAMAVTLVEDEQKPVLPRSELEAAFRATAERHPGVALRILDRLLLHRDLESDHRAQLLIQGSRLALVEQSPAQAENYAKGARDLVPASASGVLMMAEVFEATERVERIEDLVESYFENLEEVHDVSTEDVRGRVSLLTRLAELQASRPEKAIAALEQAAELDPTALDVERRKTLATLYDEAGINDDRAIANHVALLTLDPLHLPSVSAVASHYAALGDLDRAHALYSVLQLVDPGNPAATAFLGRYEVVGHQGDELDIDGLVDDPASDGGVPEALTQLWETGASVLVDHLPRIEIPQDARVSPVGDGVLAQSWGDILRRLGQTKVALVDLSAAGMEQNADNEESNGYFRVHLQQPPVILAGPRAHNGADPSELRFALGRALFFTRPQAVLGAGVARSTLARILSATLQAFHPRHVRRKHHGSDSEDIMRLSQELARKLPIRVARQLNNVFKEHEDETFDSRQWRAWIRLNGNRIGLAVSGDLDAALRVVAADRDTGDESNTDAPTLSRNPEVLNLLSFALSEPYVQARRKLGFQVRPRD